MAKEVFGEYSAFTTKNSVRYQKNSKLVSESELPVEVVTYLNKKLGYVLPPQPEQKFPSPTEEERARLIAESLRVPQHLLKEHPAVFEEPSTEILSEADFDAEVPHAPEPGEVIPTVAGDDDMSDFMDAVSIHTASLLDIAKAIFERFGIYTVYLHRLPAQDEINPLTGELFSKYHLGIAYQAAIRAQHSGVLNRAPEIGRNQLDEGRYASQHFEVDQAPQTVAESRRANSFDYRTSVQGNQPVATTEIVHEVQADGTVRAVQRPVVAGTVGTVNGAQSRYDAEEDEPLVQPNFSGKPIIRPNW